MRARLLLGSDTEAQQHVADQEAQEKLQADITRKSYREEAMEQDKRPPLKANDPDPAKLTIDEMILPDDNGIFKDELYPALRKKPPIVYVDDPSGARSYLPWRESMLIPLIRCSFAFLSGQGHRKHTQSRRDARD